MIRRLVDTAAAAVALGVQPAAVRMLAHRGRLTRHGTPGRALYDLDELLAYDAQRDSAGTDVDQAVTLSAGRSLPAHAEERSMRLTIPGLDGFVLRLDPEAITEFRITNGYITRANDDRTYRHELTGQATLTLTLSRRDAVSVEPA